MKKERTETNYRLSVEKSVEYINKFSEKTVPLLKSYELKVFSIPTEDNKLETRIAFANKQNNLSSAEVVKLSKIGAFTIINELELIATVVNSKIADRQVMFRGIGKIYCEAVEVTYDVIDYLRRTEHSNLFMETQTLYEDWRKEFDHIFVNITVNE